MNYATVVFDLWSRFPNLETAYRAQFAYMGDKDPSPYIVFGSVLVPALATALGEDDLKTIFLFAPSWRMSRLPVVKTMTCSVS